MMTLSGYNEADILKGYGTLTYLRLDGIDRVRRFLFCVQEVENTLGAPRGLRTLAMLATCMMGWVNDRTYWINAEVADADGALDSQETPRITTAT